MNAARTLPTAPALPEHPTDATGVLTGNADLEDSSRWVPTGGDAERPPLPGEEHKLGMRDYVIGFVAVTGWMIVLPYVLMAMGAQS